MNTTPRTAPPTTGTPAPAADPAPVPPPAPPAVWSGDAFATLGAALSELGAAPAGPPGALGTFVAEHALGVDGPVRENFVVGAWNEPDETAHRTEVAWPVFRTRAA